MPGSPVAVYVDGSYYPNLKQGLRANNLLEPYTVSHERTVIRSYLRGGESVVVHGFLVSPADATHVYPDRG